MQMSIAMFTTFDMDFWYFLIAEACMHSMNFSAKKLGNVFTKTTCKTPGSFQDIAHERSEHHAWW